MSLSPEEVALAIPAGWRNQSPTALFNTAVQVRVLSVTRSTIYTSRQIGTSGRFSPRAFDLTTGLEIPHRYMRLIPFTDRMVDITGAIIAPVAGKPLTDEQKAVWHRLFYEEVQAECERLDREAAHAS